MKIDLKINLKAILRKWMSISIILMLTFQQTGTAQELGKPVSIVLGNGKFLRLQVCSDRIIRVRISEKNEFPETLMERYQILKTIGSG